MEIIITRRSQDYNVVWSFSQERNQKISSWKRSHNLPGSPHREIVIIFSEGKFKLNLIKSEQEEWITLFDLDNKISWSFSEIGYTIQGSNVIQGHNRRTYLFWGETSDLLRGLFEIGSEKEFMRHPVMGLGDNFLRIVRTPSEGILPSDDGPTDEKT